MKGEMTKGGVIDDAGEMQRFFRHCAGIECVGGMGENRSESMGIQKGLQGMGIFRIKGAHASAAGIARKILEGIGAQLERGFSHAQIAAGFA